MRTNKTTAEAIAEAVAVYLARTATGDGDADLSREERSALGTRLEARLRVEPLTTLTTCHEGNYGVMSEALDLIVKAAGLVWCPWKALTVTTALLRRPGEENPNIFDGLAESKVRFRGGGMEILYPKMEVIAYGAGMLELVTALNTAKTQGFMPWIIYRRGSFTFEEFGNPQNEDYALFSVDPVGFWLKKGVSQEALENTRPLGFLYKDLVAPEEVYRWRLEGMRL